MEQTHDSKRRDLAVGDECRLLLGVCLYEVTVSEVRVILENDPMEFLMYRVTSRESHSKWFEETSQHRSDLFLREEREALANKIKDDRDSLDDLLRNIAQEEETESARAYDDSNAQD